jgi:hypothetical protein
MHRADTSVTLRRPCTTWRRKPCASAPKGRAGSEYEASHPSEAAEAEFFAARPSDGIRTWDDEGSVRYVDRVFRQM